MPTPTEPGQYWWAPPTDWRMLDQIVQVSAARVMSDVDATSSSAGSLCAQSLVQPCMPLEEWVRGTWGERIPDSPTIQAMRQVVRRDPMHTCNVTGARLCYYCGGNQGPDATNPERRDHAHDCPWRRAQEP